MEPDTVHPILHSASRMLMQGNGNDISSLLRPTAEILSGPVKLYGYEPSNHFITSNAVYSSTITVCFILFCILIYYYRDQLYMLLGMTDKNTNMEKLVNANNRLLDLFVRLSAVLGSLVLTAAGIRFIDIYLGEQIAASYPAAWILAAGAGLAVVLYIVWGFQNLLLHSAGYLTKSADFIKSLGSIRLMTIALGSMSLVIPVLLFAMASGSASGVLMVIVSIMIGAVYLLLLWKTFKFFRLHKVSIFYWFLYLCGVELIPASFPVLLAIRVF